MKRPSALDRGQLQRSISMAVRQFHNSVSMKEYVLLNQFMLYHRHSRDPHKFAIQNVLHLNMLYIYFLNY